MKQVKLYIDADALVYQATYGHYDIFADTTCLDIYTTRLRELIENLTTKITLLTCDTHVITKVIPVVSDKNNYRLSLFEEYKLSRRKSEPSETLRMVRDWAYNEFLHHPYTEADDVISYYVRHGHLGATMDKDMLRGVAGTWFDMYHTREHLVFTTQREATKFNMIQTLIGDAVDGVLGLPQNVGDPMIPNYNHIGRQPNRMNETLATTLLDELGWSWLSVFKIYLDYGFGSYELERNVRLTIMNQWFPRKGLKLFELNTKLKGYVLC